MNDYCYLVLPGCARWGTARSRAANAAVTGGGTATAATPERAADHVAGDTARDTRGECPGLVDTAHSPAGSARLDHPLGNGGDREIAYDTYNQKDNIDTAAAVGNVVGVLQGQDVRLEHQRLDLGQHRGEQVGDGKPKVHADIAGNPARERRVKAVVNGEGERQGPQNRQHD